MNIISWLLLVTLVCLLSYQVLRNKKKEQAHRNLLNRVKCLRLHKMLHFLGVDEHEFLRVIPLSDVDRLIEQCSACITLDICDGCLRDGQRINNMSFCPNYKSLLEHSKAIYHHRSH